jgi:aminoglycoside phosphotransferase (APT) family kinase protein
VPQWDPEIAVDSALATRLLAAQFPELAHLPVQLLGAGWDNTVFTVGDEWVFRFPRKQVIVQHLETEIRVLPDLAPLLPAPIPVPEHIGVPSESFPWPFFGAPMLPGVELSDAPAVSREALAPQLGRLLRALHGRDVLDALGGRLPENWTKRADMPLRVPLTVERLAAVEELWRAPARVHEVLDDALALPPPEPKAVCHGDLHLRHILVEGDRVTGLIDWIDLCRGDPALDLQVVWSVLAPEQRDAFFDTYGDVDDATLLRARAVAFFLNSAILEYSHHEGLAAIEREAIASLDRGASE